MCDGGDRECTTRGAWHAGEGREGEGEEGVIVSSCTRGILTTAPGSPGVPSLPAVPGLPSTPLAPDTPSLPGGPRLPGTPWGPVAPGEPCVEGRVEEGVGGKIQLIQ